MFAMKLSKEWWLVSVLLAFKGLRHELETVILGCTVTVSERMEEKNHGG